MAELRASRAAETGVLEVVESGGEVLSHRPTHPDMAVTPGQTGTEALPEAEERSGGREIPRVQGDEKSQEGSAELRDSALPLGASGAAEHIAEGEQPSSWMKIWRGTLGFFRSGSMTDKRPEQ